MLAVPKRSHPTLHFDFRPISVTPVLTRIMEKTVMYKVIYPAFHKLPTSLTFNDQFAFRPTGSTTAAIITLLHKVTHLLLSNPYVIIIALNFSKASDTVWHHTLLDMMAQLDFPMYIIGWFTSLRHIHTRPTTRMKPQLLKLFLPVSYRAQPLDQPLTLSTVLIQACFLLEMNCVNMLMTHVIIQNLLRSMIMTVCWSQYLLYWHIRSLWIVSLYRHRRSLWTVSILIIQQQWMIMTVCWSDTIVVVTLTLCWMSVLRLEI